VAQGKALPPEVLDQIVTRTDGIPLFIEELTKTVLESGLLRERKDDYVIDGPFPALSVPMTLHASLMARLDRLASVREVVQIAAALGPQFSHELLLAVAGIPERQLSDAMEQLIHAELIFRRGTPPDADYTFKHTLVRDVAYTSLLRANRQRLHARIAHTYETRFPEVPRVQPELLARHLTEAGLIDTAIDYWQRAGELAMARSGNAEAVHHFSAALDLVASLGDKPDRAVKELELCVKLGPALMMVKGTSSSEVRAIYSRALALRAGEDSPERFKVLWGLFYYSLTSGQLNEAAAYANDLLVVAQRLGADDLVLEGYHARWAASLWRGDLSIAGANCDQGIALYDRNRHHALAFEFSGHDPGVCALSARSINMLIAGFPDQAMKSGAEAVELARGLAHPYSLALAMWLWTIVLQFRGQRPGCRDLATNLVELSQEHHFPMMLGNGMFFLGWANVDAGNPDKGIALMEQGLELVTSAGRRLTRPYMQAVLASVKADFGKLPDAFELIDEALRATEPSGERWSEAEICRIKGRLLRARGDDRDSETWFRKSIEISRRQNARALELRAATSLAGLLYDQNRRMDARDVLAPIYNWFTEGFDTPDLRDARALLDELNSVIGRAEVAG
jgi:predicted ATPase